ncbi:hypothetical protein DPMN_054600 [Dreissena polymorpha]|uniref:Uncharacterized protein n=1 Tax=Dreissena polymorpha TaxID=45954 RepID=A0A9D4CPS5_DREPO|nr:hypothetical protein DPMN_054600 [Dreissena polymorpha]
MSASLPEHLPDLRGTRRRLLDSLKRCQDRLGSRRRLSGGARSLRDHQGTFGRIPRQSVTVLRPSGHQQDT